MNLLFKDHAPFLSAASESLHSDAMSILYSTQHEVEMTANILGRVCLRFKTEFESETGCGSGIKVKDGNGCGFRFDMSWHLKASQFQIQLWLFNLVQQIVRDGLHELLEVFNVGFMQDDLRQVTLPFDLLLQSFWHVRDHVGQDELGEINNVLRGEENHICTTTEQTCFIRLSLVVSHLVTYLNHNHKSQFGSNNVPIIYTVLVLIRMIGRIPEITIPET